MTRNPHEFLNFNSGDDSQNNENQQNCQTNQPPEILLDESQDIFINPTTGEQIITKSVIESTTFDGRSIKRIINKPFLSGNEVIDPKEIGAFSDEGEPIPKDNLVKCEDCGKVLDSRTDEANKINDEIWLCEHCNNVNNWRKIITLCSLTIIRLPYYS